MRSQSLYRGLARSTMNSQSLCRRPCEIAELEQGACEKHDEFAKPMQAALRDCRACTVQEACEKHNELLRKVPKSLFSDYRMRLEWSLSRTTSLVLTWVILGES